MLGEGPWCIDFFWFFGFFYFNLFMNICIDYDEFFFFFSILGSVGFLWWIFRFLEMVDWVGGIWVVKGGIIKFLVGGLGWDGMRWEGRGGGGGDYLFNGLFALLYIYIDSNL